MAGEWKAAIPPPEWEIYEKAGFGRKSGLGRRPALVIIDIQYRTVGDEPAPILDSIARYYRTSCGNYGWNAIRNVQPVLAAAREAEIPVVYPYVAPKSAIDAGRTGVKVPSLMEVPERGYRFVSEIAPRDGDLLIPKRHPSAFFGTPMVSYLIDLGVDTLLFSGCTTSGCVRATTMDAFAYNFHTAVMEDCVYDRSQTAHNVNLFDIDSKYADVITSQRAIEFIRSVAAIPSVAGAAR